MSVRLLVANFYRYMNLLMLFFNFQHQMAIDSAPGGYIRFDTRVCANHSQNFAARECFNFVLCANDRQGT